MMLGSANGFSAVSSGSPYTMYRPLVNYTPTSFLTLPPFNPAKPRDPPGRLCTRPIVYPKTGLNGRRILGRRRSKKLKKRALGNDVNCRFFAHVRQ